MVRTRASARGLLGQAPDVPPDDFEPRSRGRNHIWRSLPAAVRTYITTTHRSNSATTKRHQELEALASEAWDGRYVGAHEFKARVLQRAHALALHRLQAAWNARQFETGDATATPSAARPRATIYSLSSDLVADILDRVLASAPDAPEPSPNGIPKNSANWRARRTVAQVCRLFEALASCGVKSAQFALAQPFDRLPASAPAGFVTRELGRATFSSHLSQIELYIPTPAADRHVDFKTAAAALPRCTALTALTLSVEIKSDTPASVPAVVIEALTRCRKLSSLRLAAHLSTFMTRAVLSGTSVEQLSRVLPTLAQLTQMRLSDVDLCASDTFIPALERMSRLQGMSCSYALASSSWLRLLAIASLTKLELSDCRSWGALSSSRDVIAGSSRLKELALTALLLDSEELLELACILPQLTQTSKLTLTSVELVGDAEHAELAEALPRMASLRALSLDDMETHDLLGRLPRCKRLDDVCIMFVVPVDPRWCSSLSSSLAACSALRRLELSPEYAEYHEHYDDANLRALFGTLAASCRLTHLEIRGALNMRALCALGMELPRFDALASLTLHGIKATDELTRNVIVALVERAPRVVLQICE